MREISMKKQYDVKGKGIQKNKKREVDERRNMNRTKKNTHTQNDVERKWRGKK